MYKLLLLLPLLVAGCDSNKEDLRPFVAVAMKYSLMSQGTPTPSISTDCMNCRGTGKVGDGTVMSTCPVCKGTGKVTPATQQAAAAPPCKDGTCPPKAITSR